MNTIDQDETKRTRLLDAYPRERGGTTAQEPSPSPVVSANNAQSTAPPTKSYVDHFMAHSRYQPMSAEERAKVQKRERAKGIISAVGDGISSLANLYATTQYAPSVEPGQINLSERNRQRWERVNAQREAQRKEFEAGYQRALAMDRDQADKDRNYNLRVDMANREQAHRDKAFDLQKERAKRQDAQWDMSFKRQGDNDKFSQEMQKKQLGLQRARLNLERQQAARAAGGRGAGGKDNSSYHTIQLKNGVSIPISRDRLNAGNVEVLWRSLGKLDPKFRKQYEKQLEPFSLSGMNATEQAETKLQRKLEAIGAFAYESGNQHFIEHIAQMAGVPVDFTQGQATAQPTQANTSVGANPFKKTKPTKVGNNPQTEEW